MTIEGRTTTQRAYKLLNTKGGARDSRSAPSKEQAGCELLDREKLGRKITDGHLLELRNKTAVLGGYNDMILCASGLLFRLFLYPVVVGCADECCC